MKTAQLNALLLEPARNCLVGSYQGYEMITFDSGTCLEKFALLVGKRVLDISIFVPKGTDATKLKAPAFPIGSKAVAIDIQLEAAKYGIQCRAASFTLIES